MSEIGMEVPKQNLAGKLREIFTPQGQKEKWLRNHQELVSQYADVNNGLTEEQRAQAMKSIEDKATKDSRWAVAGHWGALVAVTGTVALGIVGLTNPGLIGTALEKIPWGKKGNSLLGTEFGRRAFNTSVKTRDFFLNIPQKAGELMEAARARGAQVGENIKVGAADFSKKIADAFKGASKKPGGAPPQAT